ncbi:MAG TPA: alpha/beta hydrolase [Methanocella sp.]|nr:alpha/beta hydrolase [Methanocella sp.]
MPSMKVNDLSMYYEVYGEGDPLVLIAGLGSDSQDNRSLIRELSLKYRVITFDNRGVGRTDKPDSPYTIEMMSEDTAGLLNSLGVKQAHVLGISMGGRIALDLALQHPELVKSLILTSTYARQAIGTSLPFQVRLWIRIKNHPLKKYPQPYSAFLRQLKASRGYDCNDRLDQIMVPTLILHGENDKLVPCWLAEEMHNSINSSRMITFDGGHSFFVPENRRFAEEVSAFLHSL